MPLNKIPRLRDPLNRDFVHEVKDLFMEQYKLEPDLYYKEDVKLVEETKFLLQRCIISKKKNVKDSLNMLVTMLKWRKEVGLRELKPQDFPVEYFNLGAAFLYEPDKYGNKTLYVRTAYLKTFPELKESIKEFMSYLIYQIDDDIDGKTWSVILDLTNTGWKNYDIELLMHFLTLLKDYFPLNVDYILAINFPWILSTVWTLVKRLIPPERRDVVVFISSDEIFNYIDKSNVPDVLGGTCEREYVQSPKGCISVVDFLLSQYDTTNVTIHKRVREIVKSVTDVMPEDYVNHLLEDLDQKIGSKAKGVNV